MHSGRPWKAEPIHISTDLYRLHPRGGVLPLIMASVKGRSQPPEGGQAAADHQAATAAADGSSTQVRGVGCMLDV